MGVALLDVLSARSLCPAGFVWLLVLPRWHTSRFHPELPRRRCGDVVGAMLLLGVYVHQRAHQLVTGGAEHRRLCLGCIEQAPRRSAPRHRHGGRRHLHARGHTQRAHRGHHRLDRGRFRLYRGVGIASAHLQELAGAVQRTSKSSTFVWHSIRRLRAGLRRLLPAGLQHVSETSSCRRGGHLSRRPTSVPHMECGGFLACCPWNPR
mmetsp:Transcript_44765/g.143378  ORF Transcript_44765/g.143378 Transcript_44765/m.143378 type:complete len:207 (+) Transcript_44765:1081-1701(+)